MDKLLWETLANILTICMTQTGFIADAAEAGEEGADTALRHRIALIKNIRHELGRALADFEGALSGGRDEGDVNDLFEDFSNFLREQAEGME